MIIHRLILLLGGTLPWALAAEFQVLLLSGANNHAWQLTTPVLVGHLARDPRFSVRVCEDVPALTPTDLTGVDLVISNFNTYGMTSPPPVWNAEMRQAFSAHLAAGRGFVSVHAGSSTWYDWPEFLMLTGGRWGKGTHHGKQQDAEVHLSGIDHPIIRGLPPIQVHHDEFWQNTEVLPGNLVLASATPNGSAGPEPLAWITSSGKARSFTLLLGHDAAAMSRPLFASLFLRGCQWAASGTVAGDAGR